MTIEDHMKDGMISFMIEGKMVEERRETMAKIDHKEVDNIELMLMSNNSKESQEKWIENSSSKKNNNFDFTKLI
jgi:hypothetical protein